MGKQVKHLQYLCEKLHCAAKNEGSQVVEAALILVEPKIGLQVQIRPCSAPGRARLPRRHFGMALNIVG